MGRHDRKSDDDDDEIIKSKKQEKRHRDRDESGEDDANDDKGRKRSRKSSHRSSSSRRRKHNRHDRKSRKSSGRRSRDKTSSSRDRRKKRKKYNSSSSDSSSDDDDDDDDSSAGSDNSSESEERQKSSKQKRKVVNKRLLEKLAARYVRCVYVSFDSIYLSFVINTKEIIHHSTNTFICLFLSFSRGETLEEREERRSRQRSEKIATQFGYTPEDNPFRDPNLHEPFSWKKKEETTQPQTKVGTKSNKISRKDLQSKTIAEIQKVRNRRKDREVQMLEMERIRAEESRMREQENYDDWVRKEEEFHLRQQRQRSAIRLVEGREKPIDILAKNVLMFGVSEHNTDGSSGGATYREKYNALEEVESLEAELEEPHLFLRDLKLEELQELEGEVRAFCNLEREASSGALEENSVLQFWEALLLVVSDEIKRIQTGGEKGSYATISTDICQLFQDKSALALDQMKVEIQKKISSQNQNEGGLKEDTDYWRSVLHHLSVFQAKINLSEMHSKMLVRQLEKLEKRKDALAEAATRSKTENDSSTLNPNNEDRNVVKEGNEVNENDSGMVPASLPSGDLEEELGLNSEVLLGQNYTWQEKYRPRKPRYFNRVKTGYDWNKYNQTHYDHDNPPPKTVQGYKVWFVILMYVMNILFYVTNV